LAVIIFNFYSIIIIKFFYSLVVGQQEQTNGTINIRTRDNKQHGEFSIDEVIRRFKELAETRTNHAEDEFAGSSVDSNVAGATSKLEATNISDNHDEQQ
jgi:threonyl-tRNA synthetase